MAGCSLQISIRTGAIAGCQHVSASSVVLFARIYQLLGALYVVTSGSCYNSIRRIVCCGGCGKTERIVFEIGGPVLCQSGSHSIRDEDSWAASPPARRSLPSAARWPRS